ncbi:DUF4139 domain-containing protein [Candidatus Peregrinibacteria bacterium]|nr:DUF4139 domain-containing protein [Candidatus Peregrinibacteria bacterium]
MKKQILTWIAGILGILALFGISLLLPTKTQNTRTIPRYEPITYVHKTTTEKPLNFFTELASADAGEKESVALTVYNGDLALVKEYREIDLKKGANQVKFTDVPEGIMSSSVLFQDLAKNVASVFDQTFSFDLVSKEKLLEKYLGKKVSVNVTRGDTVQTVSGTLLSSDWGNVVLQTEDKVMAVSNPEDISFEKLPDGLIIKPTLIWTLFSPEDGKHETETSYLSTGFSWKADYVAEVNEKNTEIFLKGWTTLTNSSGTTFPAAKLKLVAGEVNRVQPFSGGYAPMADYGYAEEKLMAPQPAFVQENLFEYHLYSLDTPTDILARSEKQISLLEIPSVPVEKELVYDPQKDGSRIRAEIFFENSEKNNMGMPLPAGTARVYQADSEGSLQFIGEDSIDHTPKNEEVRLFLGNVFDVTVEKREMNRRTQDKLLPIGKTCEFVEEEVEVHNRKDEKVSVTIYADEWWGNEIEIIGSDASWEKEEAGRFKTKAFLGANEEKIVKYTIKRCW